MTRYRCTRASTRHSSSGRRRASSARRSRTPSHSPSVQYLRLWRDSRPGRATFEISYCAIAGRLEPLHRRQIHRRGVIVWRLRPAGARHVVLERRVRIHLEQVERQVIGRRARSRASTDSQPVVDAAAPGSHIIRSRLTLSKPAARASRDRGARAIGAVQARQPAQLVVAERLHAEAEAVDAGRAVGGEPRSVTVSGLASSVTSRSAASVERRRAGGDDARRSPSGSSSDGVPPPKKIVSAAAATARRHAGVGDLARRSAST